MDAKERKRLEAKGVRFMDAEDFLGLDEVERQLVDLRVRLARETRRRREEAGLSQSDLATRIESSQPRVAKIEGDTIGVSLDLLLRAFFASGGRPGDLLNEIQ